ncbi:ral GTPase-activating protein subunit beta [Plutella xylostella]|uniref:ral GTPase-activating protein subunit beta n=1 Tax=Plutella xylostella TaxID=51655 RepID=UPI00203280AA|nr:ral GTPase-activating protein subunit beta [Plutella xylostella]
MNVGLFNRVNNKSGDSDGMYAEWSSLPLEGGGAGVLGAVGGREVVLAVVKQLTETDPSPLHTDAEVEWVLEVIRFGLSLPLQEHEAVRDCVRVCCSWLSPLLPPAQPAHPPPPALPAPVAAAPRRYARKILSHLHNLFVPRPNESGDLINKQAVLCHRVLRVARALAGSAELGASEWRSLLLLLLSAAAALLAPPAPPHSPQDQFCQRVLCVLFEVWILACHRCFPSPPLWRTLRVQCLRWRHRAALVEQWTRVSLCLTARLLRHMYPPLFPPVPVSEEDSTLIPPDMSADAVMQTWYRILHTIGNPVDLCRPHVISQTPDFLQYSITQEEGARDPSQHPCLQALPSIFHKAMKAIAAHVDAFLGNSTSSWWGTTAEPEDSTPPPHRRLAKSFSVSNAKRNDKQTEKGAPRTSLMGLSSGGRPVSVAPTTPPNSITSHVGECEKLPLTPLRPKVNSIFHLFGEWLFEAALIGTQPASSQPRAEGTPPPSSLGDVPPPKINMMSYQPGRAEALGTLCRVLCSKQCGEEVLAAYLARCYAAIHRGLRDPATAAAVVLNAHDIFRQDLDGVLVLVPDFIYALERILPEREPKLECGSIDKRELRKAAISLLLSMVAFPYHYRGLPIPEFPGSNDNSGTNVLASGRISLLCVGAVGAETEDALAAPLLGALYLCVRHAAPTTPRLAASNSHHTDYKARSESGGSVGGSDGSSLDDLTADVRDLDPTSPVFGAALVVRATYLVCHRLISSWKGDLQVSLAALELLSGLAKLHSAKPEFVIEAIERKRAVRWICDYITVQCGRPPQAHSRDLHSCVVAAYSCLSSWLCPALLADAECLGTLMEVVELGISGSKSQGKPGEPPKMKHEKELKPVSMRVRDAAESLLMLIVEQQYLSSGARCRLDERWLASLGHTNLRHYVVDGSILLTLLEEPLANSQEPQPTLIVIARSSWGRYAWSLCSRGAPRSATRGGGGCPRPVDMGPAPPPPRRTVLPLPPSPPCATDASFPRLDAVLRQLNDPAAPALFKMLEQQAAVERAASHAPHQEPEECVPPEPVTEFQTARLFLSNFGYLNIGGDKKTGPPRLIALDSTKPGFSEALRRIDSTGPRAAVTVHVMYARAGQTVARDIVANSSTPLPSAFVHMLRGLGTPVRVRTHPGWTGHVSSSYDAARELGDSPPPPPSQGQAPCVYDGREQVLYWSDATNEIAFVVPSLAAHSETDENKNESVRSDVDGSCLSSSTRTSEKPEGSCWDVSSNSSGAPSYERSISESDRGEKRVSLSEKTRALSLELDKQAGLTGSGRRNREYSTKILIIWLEDFEDHLNMPIDDLLQYCDTGLPWRRHGTCVISVSGRRSGLVRVRTAAPGAGPLADGALLAPHLLPDCLRRAALDVAARRRLNSDTHQPPHVRRRHLIQEMAQQYRRELSEPELLESLFLPP